MSVRGISVEETGVLVVGSGGAGLRAAIAAHDAGARVLIITKGRFGLDGATVAAEADMAVDSASCARRFGLPGDLEDSSDAFLRDMIVEGEYLNDQKLARRHVEDAPERLADLVGWGASLREIVLTPGHSAPRGVWIPGRDLADILRKQIQKRAVPVREHTLATRLVKGDDGLLGVLALDASSGEHVFFRGRAVILCTGGAARIYPYATVSEFLTGDGLSMAFDAGAEVADMEFPMFLPYTLLSPKAVRGIPFTHDVTNYLDAWALNREGVRYMRSWDPVRMERTTRDVNSAAAGVEILEGRGSPSGGTWLSLAHLPANLIAHSAQWFPESLRNWRYGGIDLGAILPDLSREAVETIPAAHFWNGGIRIDENGATNVPGLFAAGEGTSGIHGANRISGNAITQIFVWGARAGASAAEYSKGVGETSPGMELIERFVLDDLKYLERGDGVSPADLRRKIRNTAWNNAGLVRDEERLRTALEDAKTLAASAELQTASTRRRIFNREWWCAISNTRMIQVLRLTAEAALLRKESRGAHFRRDFPETDDTSWLHSILMKKAPSGDVTIESVPVEFQYFAPEGGKRPYGRKGGAHGEKQTKRHYPAI